MTTTRGRLSSMSRSSAVPLSVAPAGRSSSERRPPERTRTPSGSTASVAATTRARAASVSGADRKWKVSAEPLGSTISHVLGEGLWHLDPEALDHGDLGRAGRLALDLERAGPEATWGCGPLGAVVAEVTDATDASPTGQVEHGASGEEHDLHAGGDRQPSQGASGSRDDGGSPRIGHQARECAVEITGHEDRTVPSEREDAPREPGCRDRELVLRSQRRPPLRHPRHCSRWRPSRPRRRPGGASACRGRASARPGWRSRAARWPPR